MESKDYRLRYKRLGKGARVLIFFHGFGQTGEIFLPWIPYLPEGCTIYLLDLFFHGASTAPFQKLSKQRWQEEFGQFLQREQIDHFELVGFSLGGRFAIATSLLFAQRIRRLTLLAPDAIYLTPWFHMATAPVMKSVFYFFMMQPKLLDRFIRFAVRTGIVSKYLADFVNRELGTLDNRQRVYRSWNYFKPLGFSHGELRDGLSRMAVPKHLLIGKKDIVIPPNKIIPIIESAGFQIEIFDKKHHQLIKADVAAYLMKAYKK